jgi:hypothetical protein
LTADLTEFTADAFAEYRLYKNSYFCLATGFDVGTVLMSFVMTMSFRQCYKILLNTFPFCLFSQFAEGSTWYDECGNSDEELITLYTYNPITEP